MLKNACIKTAAILTVFAAGTAHAQDQRHRGFETGVEVFSSQRTGEIAWYAGGFQGNQMIGIRIGERDETAAIPCSIGATYEYVAWRTTTTRAKPTAGASFNRIFSCASDSDVVERPAPPIQGAVTVSGGVRVPILTGRISGSLKLEAYVERARAHEPSADVTSKGFVVGVVFHGR
jgi:hypothetical protein